MPSIFISERYIDRHLISVKVFGVLDSDALPVLKKVCQSHLRNKKTVLLNLKGTQHICREARDYLDKIKNRVQLEDVPIFMQLS